jgi:FtsZ-binding cell division protein ZapB
MTNPPLTREERDELKRLEAAAKESVHKPHSRHCRTEYDDTARCSCEVFYAYERYEQAACEAVPRLLAAVDALEGDNTRLTQLVTDALEQHEDSCRRADTIYADCMVRIEEQEAELAALRKENERLTANYPGGDKDSQARAWSRVWKTLEAAGIYSFLGTGCTGSDRAVEFIAALRNDAARYRTLSRLAESFNGATGATFWEIQPLQGETFEVAVDGAGNDADATKEGE